MKPYKENKLSFKKAVRIVLLSLIPSIIFVSIIFTYQRYSFSKKIIDPNYNIKVLIEECYSKDTLEVQELAELLDLSKDEPQNIYAFDIKEGERKLERTSAIKWASIHPLPPVILEVSYEMRQPIFKIKDIENMACDAEFCLFYLHPFFKPKNLPEVFIGDIKNDRDQAKKKFLVAHEIYKMSQIMPSFDIKSIDVSRVFLDVSEIVICVEERKKIDNSFSNQAYLLRLHGRRYKEGITSFLEIQHVLKEEIEQNRDVDKMVTVTVDLRASQFVLFKIEHLEIT